MSLQSLKTQKTTGLTKIVESTHSGIEVINVVCQAQAAHTTQTYTTCAQRIKECFYYYTLGCKWVGLTPVYIPWIRVRPGGIPAYRTALGIVQTMHMQISMVHATIIYMKKVIIYLPVEYRFAELPKLHDRHVNQKLSLDILPHFSVSLDFFRGCGMCVFAISRCAHFCVF